MKFFKILGIALVIYIGIVAIAEGLVGYIQPDMPGGVELITKDGAGEEASRKLAGFWFEKRLYVGSNHWLRGWYYRAIENPRVEVVIKGERAFYNAIPVQGAERDRVNDAYSMGFILRLICGFAPSKFLRLDPV